MDTENTRSARAAANLSFPLIAFVVGSVFYAGLAYWTWPTSIPDPAAADNPAYLLDLIQAQNQKILVAETIAIGGVVVAAIGAFSGLYFGWRNDSRLSKEQKLKIEMLELQINELKDKSTKKKLAPGTRQSTKQLRS